MNYERDLQDVITAIQNAKRENIKVNLLIGAGCSASANIPIANDIVKIIKEQFPGEYQRTIKKDYGNCMTKLTPTERKKLITGLVNKAKINWAHIAIAQLLKHSYIDRVLTVNFDNLLQRACSLVGEFPGIYDLTTSTEFRTDLLFDKSIIHLHGQHTGFVLCNTETELTKQLETIRPVFKQLNQNSLWIIVGYSGSNDPLFNLLKEEEIFEHRLFWVGYKNTPPEDHVVEHLLSEEKYAFFVGDYDADNFFVQLSQNLECFPPTFIQKPFTYLDDTLSTITEYKIPGIIRNQDILLGNDTNKTHLQQLSGKIQVNTKRFIRQAIDLIENDLKLVTDYYLLAGLFDKVIEIDRGHTSKEFIDKDLEFNFIIALKEEGKRHVDFTLLEEALLRINKIIDLSKREPKYLLLKSDILLALNIIPIFNKQDDAIEKISEILDLYEECFIKTESFNYLIEYYYFIELILSFNEEIPEPKFFQYLEKLLSMLYKYKDIVADNIEVPEFITSELCYTLVQIQEFSLAEQFLNFFENTKEFLHNHSLPYLEANWGFWFFNNIELDKDYAEEQGVLKYKSALQSLSTREIRKAFEQKYYYEYCVFLYRHDEFEKSAQYLFKAIKIGPLEENLITFENCIQFYKEIDMKITSDYPVYKEIAAALEDIPKNLYNE